MWTIRKNVSGRLWYTHNATGLKTHLKPTTAALSGFSGLPPGWVEQKTPNGQVFYFNKRTGASSWTKPANSLPDGWRELRTPDLVPFYINEQLGLSAWDRPGQQPRQQKNASKVIVRRARPGQPNTPQNVGDNILSATINAARLTGQGVEMASRQVGKLGKKKNWRKMGRMLNQVNAISGDGSGSDGEYNDYNEDGGFGFGGDDSGGYQDQQQGQFQQAFDYQQSQQSFTFEDNQQPSMFQQTPDEQPTFEFTTQYEQPTYEQQPGQFSVTTEISYTTTDAQPYEQQQSFEYQQVYEQPGNEVQQPTFEQAPNQEPVTVQQIETFEPVIPSEQPVQPDQEPQPVYAVPPQQAYSTQQYTYESAQVPQMPQQSVTVSYEVPSYVTEPAPAPLFTQAQGPAYPIFMPNNQPEIITSDVPLVEVPGKPDNTNSLLGGGYDSNDILAGTSLVADNNAVLTQTNPAAPQDNVVVEVTFQPSPTTGFEVVSTPTPVVGQEYGTLAKPASFVTVETVQPEIDFKTGERCNALI
ncbi:tpa inducible [Fusarium heterosporum]|uniref:Tpa inducible n=1 Tax=Fusarium heterosporum TaxID=42747 RepID=A0A8H5ST63_FUSHE|nr:tpa inducible [Fusarium heterosporum]